MLKHEEEVREYLNELRDHEMPTTKHGIRRALWQRKKEELIDHRDQLKRVERAAINLMKRVDYTDIDPIMVWVSEKDRKIWNYMRHTVSSAPWMSRPGRAMYMFAVDKNTNGILGIVDIGSDLQSLGKRDQHIGWTFERKMKGGGLRHVANLGTCVGVRRSVG